MQLGWTLRRLRERASSHSTGSSIRARKKPWLLIFSLLVLTGCPIVVTKPKVPPDAHGPEPHGTYFTHSYQLVWDHEDLTTLIEMSVSHPGAIEMVPADGAGSLQVSLMLDVQTDHHEELAKAYVRDFMEASQLFGDHPRLAFPMRSCVEPDDAVRKPLEGICVRKLVISVPTDKLLSFHIQPKSEFRAEEIQFKSLTLKLPNNPPDTPMVARLLTVHGDVQLEGGSDGTLILVDSVDSTRVSSGELIARLDAASRLILSRITGRVYIDIKNHESSYIRLDGTQIDRLPFDRPSLF